MQFRLFYQGPLPSNGTLQDKHHIRLVFHSQLEVLWKSEPFLQLPQLLQPKDEHPDGVLWPSILQPIEQIVFAPLVCGKLRLFAEIDLTLLTPGSPGQILSSGGDIDNRLKTLFDAMSLPKKDHVINLKKKGCFVPPVPTPFHCLLEDDRLINKVGIAVDRLLFDPKTSSEVILLMLVTLKSVVMTPINSSFVI